MTSSSESHVAYRHLQVSAEAHRIYPQVLGLGSNAWMPDGLGAKINALRRFVHSVAPQDIVICSDAFDVLVLGDPEEIIQKFQQVESESNRSIVFNAEPACYPASDGICESTPPARHRWRYLNAGMLLGRAKAIAHMLQEDVADGWNDQYWYQLYRKKHPEEIFLDTECKITCTFYDLQQDQLVEGRIHVPETESVPPLIHFVSFGHWTRWREGKTTSHLHDVFKKLYPQESARLLEGWWFGINVASSHDLVFYDGPGFWSSMRAVLCLQCRLGSASHECEYFGPTNCLGMTLGSALILLSLLLVLARCCGVQLPCRWAKSRRKSPHLSV
ncbi:unnamed protein product [Durusdinium trenchii]|uniref:PLOD1-3-like GT domain-containing protein n=2 Tax=Durusdinium trenchii TaxID=1381693 RepID=A0ABP0RTF0_9DINO